MFDDIKIIETGKKEIPRIRAFLEKSGLGYEDDIEYTVALVEGGKMLATGSFSKDILKCIAVDESVQEGGLTSRVITALLKKEHELGRSHLFLFTKPDNAFIFSALGFKEIERAGKAVLMEIGTGSIEKYLDTLNIYRKEGENGAVVVNCNPFTLGHRYLIKTAAASCAQLYVFVVEEDLSLFPFKERLILIRKGTADLKNVTVLNGGKYIISSSTFPTYFLRNETDDGIVAAQTEMDIRIFARYIAPHLGIRKRFVGTEPYCGTTSKYNDTMKRILPVFGIELVEVARKETLGTAISASKVRELLKAGEISKVKDLVPSSTYEFLDSPEAAGIIEKIKRSRSRH